MKDCACEGRTSICEFFIWELFLYQDPSLWWPF
jgi:hypothetical protein